MKKILLAGLSLLTFATLVACSGKVANTNSDQWEKYEASKSITIGFDNTFVPMGFVTESGETEGFDIDLATAVFDTYGIKINWQPINWDLKETELDNGNIDLIWNGYSATDERREKVLFTEAYMQSRDVLVTKKSSKIEKLADMKDKKVGAQAGSSGYDAFNAQPEILKDFVADNDATQYETFNEALIDLKNGRIDGLLVDHVYANYYLTAQGIVNDYTLIDAGYGTDDFAVGARKTDTTLVEKINQALKDLYQSGEFQKISEKWFSEDVASAAIKN